MLTEQLAQYILWILADDEAMERFEMVKQRLDEIDEKLVQLRKKIDVTEEELTVRETRLAIFH